MVENDADRELADRVFVPAVRYSALLADAVAPPQKGRAKSSCQPSGVVAPRGTWTDPDGPQGNWITFDFTVHEFPNSIVRLFEGVVRARRRLGDAECIGGWWHEPGLGPARIIVSAAGRKDVYRLEVLGSGNLRLALDGADEATREANALGEFAQKTLAPLPAEPDLSS